MNGKGMFGEYFELENKSIENCYNTPYCTTGIKLECYRRASSGKLIDIKPKTLDDFLIVLTFTDSFFIDRELFNL